MVWKVWQLSDFYQKCFENAKTNNIFLFDYLVIELVCYWTILEDPKCLFFYILKPNVIGRFPVLCYLNVYWNRPVTFPWGWSITRKPISAYAELSSNMSSCWLVYWTCACTCADDVIRERVQNILQNVLWKHIHVTSLTDNIQTNIKVMINTKWK